MDKFKFAAIVLLLSLSSCISISPLTVDPVQCCEVRKLSSDESEIGVSVKVHNPNQFPIYIKSYDLNFSIGGNVIGGVQDHSKLEIPASSFLEKAIFVTTSTKTLVNGAMMMGLNALFNKNSSGLEIEVTGTVQGKAKGISKKVNVSEKYPLKLDF